MTKSLITPNQIAELLGIQTQTVYLWVRQKRIPFYRVGRLIKFDEQEVLAHFKSSRAFSWVARKLDNDTAARIRQGPAPPELAKVVIAGDLLHDSFPLVRASASLIEALERFSHHDGERLPVVSHDRHLVGSISKTDVILALAGSTARSATVTGSPGSV